MQHERLSTPLAQVSFVDHGGPRLKRRAKRHPAEAGLARGRLRMPARVLFAAVEAVKSRLLHAWTAGWSVPADEVFVSARLPPRDVDAGGRVADRWLLRAARSAAVKWRGEVCGTHRGQVRSVVVTGAGLLQPVPIRVHGAVHVTARYCGRIPDGGFCFRHSLCDTNGSEILHFVSQIYFDPSPDLPAYPALKYDVDDDSRDLYQASMRRTMTASVFSDSDFSEKSTSPPIDTKQHAATSGIS